MTIKDSLKKVKRAYINAAGIHQQGTYQEKWYGKEKAPKDESHAVAKDYLAKGDKSMSEANKKFNKKLKKKTQSMTRTSYSK